jgi:hypothetical protein
VYHANGGIIQIVCNLYDGGFNFSDLDRRSLSQISAILEEGIEAGNGIIGFGNFEYNLSILSN